MDERKPLARASAAATARPPGGARPTHRLRTLLLAAAGAAAAGWLASPAAAQACTTLTPACTNQRPHPELDPMVGSYSTSSVTVTVNWTDDHDDLNLSSRWVTLNGTNVWSSFTATGGPGTTMSTATLTLAAGLNTIVAHVCDNGASGSAALCADNTAVLSYQAPPASASYAAAAVSIRGGGGGYRAVAPGDAVASYGTPAYVARGAEQGATLVYTAGQATARAAVKVDVVDASVNAPSMMSIAVRDSATGAWATSAPTYFLARTGSQILGATFYAPGTTTGARTYDVVVTSHWLVSRGAPKDTTIEAPARRVRVLHLNEAASPFGAGWTMPGLQRAYVQANGDVMITHGDGSAVLFTYSGGTFTAPAGEFSTLTLAAGVYTRTSLDGTAATFASNGRLQAVDTRYGSHTAYGYDASLRLTSITDPAGKVTTLAYYGTSSGNNSNKLYTITDPGGRVSTFAYDADANLADVTGVDGVAAFHGTYAASPAPAHRLLTRTLRGRVAGFAYDAAGLLAADTLPSVGVEGAGVQRPVARYVTVDARSLGGTYASPVARVSSSANDFTDPRGMTTSVTFDGFGQPAFILTPYDYTIINRNANGQPVKVTSPSGMVTTYAWSGPDLVHVHETGTNPAIDNHVDFWKSGSLFHLDTLVISGNAPVHNRYGAYGELLRTWSGTDSTQATVYTYHSGDRYRVATVTDAQGHQTAYAYQGSGVGTGFQNLLSVTEPDPVGGTLQTTYAYDAHGRTVTVTTPAGTSTGAFDALNRQTLAVDAAGDSTRYAFPSDSVSTVTDASSKVYTLYRNALGRLTSEVHPDTRSRSYGYDLSGNLVRRTDRRSQAVTLTYDSINRVKTRTADGITTAYGYGPATAPWASAVNSATNDTLFLDKLERVRDEVSIFAGTRFARGSSYLDEGPRSSLQYAVGVSYSASVEYGYNNGVQLSSILAPGDYVATTLGYTDGLPSAVDTRMSSTVTLSQTLQYTPTHQPSLKQWNVVAVNQALAREWSYDGLGRVVQRSNLGDTQRRTYEYDAADRLVGKEDLHSYTGPLECENPLIPETCHRDILWASDSTAAYPFDRVGNRTDAGTTMVSGTNRYATFRGYTLAYDFEGNLTSKTKSGYSQTYTWNALGQLASVTTNGTTVSYVYDGFGRRVKRTQGATVNYFVYDGNHLLLETDGSGTILREYAYYPGTDQPYSLRSWSGGVATKYYYTTEYPGHVSGLVNTSRAVANQYRYTPWGEPESTTEAVAQPLRYMARELDSTSGLYYVRARWYDPALARFDSEDPIGLGGGINQYAFAGNSPTNHRDPSGLEVECTLRYIHHFRQTYAPDGTPILVLIEKIPFNDCQETSGGNDPNPGARGGNWPRGGGNAGGPGAGSGPSFKEFAGCVYSNTRDHFLHSNEVVGGAGMFGVKLASGIVGRAANGSWGLLRTGPPFLSRAIPQYLAGGEVTAVYQGASLGLPTVGMEGFLMAMGEGAIYAGVGIAAFEVGLGIGSGIKGLAVCIAGE